MSITYFPKKRKRKGVHGFLVRKKKEGKVLKRRRKKGRWHLSV
jgi:ribosomal protein L34